LQSCISCISKQKVCCDLYVFIPKGHPSPPPFLF
jgi:hypothetical protein